MAENVVMTSLGTTFAAFCVWLIVRLVNRRERWARRTAAVIAMLLVGYPLSVGPAIWLAEKGLLPASSHAPIWIIYEPLRWLLLQSPEPAVAAFRWYLEFWK